jgi:riboflavin kinase/FMN adenylyltransferase
MSIGFNPTVEDSPRRRTIEVNIIGFDREIYGSAVCVEFRYRLRDELKFDDLAGLARQIAIDREIALKLLS